MNDRAVSPLIGFILLLAIIMGFLGLVQSKFVPEWNKAVEIEHFEELESQISEIPKILFLSTSTGKQGVLSIDAGCEYPNRMILVNPPTASTTITAVPLSIEVDANLTLPSGEVYHYSDNGRPFNFTTYAIIAEPNYFYLSKRRIVIEHSAVLKIDDLPVSVSDPPFEKNRIELAILNVTFRSLSTTQQISLTFTPISYGGSVLVKNGTITLKVLPETFEWWNETLFKIFGAGNVSRDEINGRISIRIRNTTLGISYIAVQASSGGSVKVSEKTEPYTILRLQPPYAEVNLTAGSTQEFGVKVVDWFLNPIRGGSVRVEVIGGIGDLYGASAFDAYTDDEGEVWVHLNTTSDFGGDCIPGRVKFNASGVETVYNVTLCKPSYEFALEFPLAVIYNARTGTLSAFGDEVDDVPSTYDVPADRPLSGDAIAYDDGVYEVSNVTRLEYYAAQRFVFHVDSSRNVSEFCVNWKGYGGFRLSLGIVIVPYVDMYIWNFATSGYDVITEYTYTDTEYGTWIGKCYYGSEARNYVSNDGKIVLLVRTSTLLAELGTDYIQLQVVYE